MKKHASIDFERIAKAIRFIECNVKTQPCLEDIAAHVRLSPSHFQRLFTDWAGTNPKKFLQCISIEHAKKLLQEDRASLLEASLKTGLSSSSRLHDLFITIEGMTPGEYKNGGENLTLNYQFTDSPFGKIIIASTSRGIAHLAFVEGEREALTHLQARFPKATFRRKSDRLQQTALRIFGKKRSELGDISLHLKGTDFQLNVWKALLTIPPGRLSTYGNIAARIDRPTACRAVGTAVGDNPVAFLIPCHRVIQSSGVLGNYHWGTSRKTAMIGWEGAHD